MCNSSLLPPHFVVRHLSVDDRIRLLRLTLRVRRLRRHYVASLKQLRDVRWGRRN